MAAFVQIVGNQIIMTTSALTIGFSQPLAGYHGFRIVDIRDMMADIEGVSLNPASMAFDQSRIAYEIVYNAFAIQRAECRQGT